MNASERQPKYRIRPLLYSCYMLTAIFLLLREALRSMADWGFFEWLAYAPIFIAAVILAIEGAYGMAPELSSRRSIYSKSPFVKIVPLIMLVFSLFVFGASSLFSQAEGKMLIYEWGPAFPGGILKWGDENSFDVRQQSVLGIDGTLLQSYAKKKFTAVGVCFHHIESGDLKDVIDISKSGTYDISKSDFKILIPWNKKFKVEMLKGYIKTVYSLLIIPPGISPDQFTSIRQAEALGAIDAKNIAGPP